MYKYNKTYIIWIIYCIVVFELFNFLQNVIIECINFNDSKFASDLLHPCFILFKKLKRVSVPTCLFIFSHLYNSFIL